MDQKKRDALKRWAEGCIERGQSGMMMHCTDVIALCDAGEQKAPPLPERKRVKAESRQVPA